jgi:hypothetical protein
VHCYSHQTNRLRKQPGCVNVQKMRRTYPYLKKVAFCLTYFLVLNPIFPGMDISRPKYRSCITDHHFGFCFWLEASNYTPKFTELLFIVEVFIFLIKRVLLC